MNNNKTYSTNSRVTRTSKSNKKRNTNNKHIDEKFLTKKASTTTGVKYVASRNISDLNINSIIKDLLIKKGYQSPTEIQDKTIDFLNNGQNLLGIAQTGTGKTAAFLVPILNQILNNKNNNKTLIVAPTRELAIQINDELKSISKGLNIYSNCFIGGTNINKDISSLRRQSDIIIGTPGRILDLVNRRVLDLRIFTKLVLDEFDRMLDMGFVHDVKLIISKMNRRKQTMLFSATLDLNQNKLIDEILVNFQTVKVNSGKSSADNVNQSVIKIQNGDKKLLTLLNLLKKDDFEKVIIFDETKHRVNKLWTLLVKNGIKSEQIHGNKSQNARQNALENFKNGKAKVLVATDVAARGIDVDNVSHVINYQIPTSYDSYIHRIGRTGRAGKFGEAITLIQE